MCFCAMAAIGWSCQIQLWRLACASGLATSYASIIPGSSIFRPASSFLYQQRQYRGWWTRDFPQLLLRASTWSSLNICRGIVSRWLNCLCWDSTCKVSKYKVSNGWQMVSLGITSIQVKLNTLNFASARWPWSRTAMYIPKAGMGWRLPRDLVCIHEPLEMLGHFVHALQGVCAYLGVPEASRSCEKLANEGNLSHGQISQHRSIMQFGGFHLCNFSHMRRAWFRWVVWIFSFSSFSRFCWIWSLLC